MDFILTNQQKYGDWNQEKKRKGGTNEKQTMSLTDPYGNIIDYSGLQFQ
jgi:extradiol dioxygenase family protein